MSEIKLQAKELLKALQESGQKAVLDIGCGKVKRGTIGLDHMPGENVDIVSDFGKELPFPDDSLDGIIMYHSLEHVVDPVGVLRECRRVLKEGGVLDIKVPHHSNVSAYQIHHKSYWNYYSLDPLVSEGHKSNEQEKLFTVIRKELNLTKFKFLNSFFSKRPFLYETYLYRLFPCYEIHFVLRK
jgi:ubiquinone/menaquinone biosynthesis C-methylase UbiE